MFGRQPTISRILFSAVAALTVGLGVVAILAGFSDSPPLRLLEGVAVFAAGAMLIVGAVVAAMVHLGGWRDPESEEDFERLVVRAELLAEEGLWGDADDEHDYDYDDDRRRRSTTTRTSRRSSARRSTSCHLSSTGRWNTSRSSFPTAAAAVAPTGSTRVTRSLRTTSMTGS